MKFFRFNVFQFFLRVCVICFFLPCFSFGQEIELNALFSDGMVLQQQSSVSIFGKTEPNYAFNFKADWMDESIIVKSNTEGRFLFKVNTPSAGGPYKMQVGDKLIEDILIGEVWLGSGQSNMQMRLNETDISISDLKNAPKIRVFTVPVQDSKMPISTLTKGNWVSGEDLEAILKVSAVAYHFATTIQEELNVPVGIVTASRGASAAEEWIKSESYNRLPYSIRSQYKSDPPKYPSSWYNGMIHPIIPFTFKGVIWYQGEANVPRLSSYPLLIETFVDDLRSGFENDKLPFFMVQLPAFKRDWQEFRLVQESISDSMNHGGLVTTIDLGDENDIHPKRKKEVGQRLAFLSLSKVYQRDFRYSSPRFSHVEFDGKHATISFLYAEDGLITTKNEAPNYFEIAGIDGVYYPAKATIQRDKIEVYSMDVTEPVAVRYFWVNYGEPNLFSQDGFPVAPFNFSKMN